MQRLLDRLSSRELEVASWTPLLYQYKCIAVKLDLSTESIRHHLSNIYYKIGGEKIKLALLVLKEDACPKEEPMPMFANGALLNDDLTPRETEIAALVVSGWQNRPIADHFHIGEPTVKHHISRIFEKKFVECRVELAVKDYTSRLIQPHLFLSQPTTPTLRA